MKSALIAIAAAVRACLLPVAVAAQGYQWGSLTADDATGLVRTFENQPALELAVSGPYSAFAYHPSMYADSLVYSLSGGDYRYTVSCATATSFVRHDATFSDNEAFDLSKGTFYGQQYDLAVLAGQAMSQEAALAIAQAFVSAHHPAPQILALYKTVGHKARDAGGQESPFTDYYDYDFAQDCGNGVQGPSGCHVRVDTVRGRVLLYRHDHYPLLVSVTAQISGDQAMAAAIAAVLGGAGTADRVERIRVLPPDAFGQECLAYRVYFTCTAGDQTGIRYVADVDALSGNVVYWDVIQSGSVGHGGRGTPARTPGAARMPDAQPSSLKTAIGGRLAKLAAPPLLLCRRPYVWARYLAYGAPGARVAYERGGHVTVRGSGRDLAFAVGSRSFRLNGTHRALPCSTVLVRGRCYVPLEAAEAVMPFRISYDSPSRTVRFDPLQKASR